MWFAKWFGGRRKVSEMQDDEPARFAAPRNSHHGPGAGLKSGTIASDANLRAAARPKAAGANKGFDPYNSGAFERRNAWERTGRR